MVARLQILVQLLMGQGGKERVEKCCILLGVNVKMLYEWLQDIKFWYSY